MRLISITAFLFFTSWATSQVLYNNNGSIFVSGGGILQVNGTAQNGAGTVENNGTTNILVDYVNDDLTQGDGVYNVTGNWENNSVFTPQISHVFLDGANQLITGTAVTSFYNLTTVGTGIKTQTIDSRVLNILDLTDRELATDANTMFVDNPATTAITFTTGFVSSDPITGRLDRATNSAGVYIFPTGSSTGTLRYRPIEIQPVAATATRYEVRFANFDATTEGYDRTLTDTNICLINPLWFHIINRSLGTTDASVTIFYDPVADGTWTGMAQWNVTPIQWEDMGAVAVGTAAPFDFLTKNNWNDWTDEPYAITNTNPVFDVTGTDVLTCGLNDGTLNFTLLDPNTNYTITYDSAGVAMGPINITTDASGNATINVGSGVYTNITVSDGSCSHTSSATITINEPPTPLAPTAGTDATYCDGDVLVDMTVNGTGGTFTWYSDAGLTTVLGTGATWTPSNTIGATTYYVTETVAGCESPASMVTITINVCCDLDVSTVITDEVCDGANDGAVAFTINGTATYDVIINGNTEFTGVGAGAQNWIGQADGTYAVQIVDANDPSCDTTFNVTINPGATVPITSEAVTDITDCVNPDGTFTVTATGATSYELYTAAGGLVTTNATGAFTGLNAGDYYVIASDGTCTGQSSTLTINNASAPAAPTAGTDATYCDGDALANMTATAGAGGTLTWYDDAALTNVIGSTATQAPTNTVGTTIYYVTETVAGCESAASTVAITINPIPAAPTAGTDATYCLGDALNDMTATAGSGGTLNWYDDMALTNMVGTGATQAPNNTVGVTTYYVTETANGCASTASTVTVTINDVPAITAENATDNTDCVTPNGTITITSNGTNYELFDASNNSIATNATGAFTGLDVGDYYVVVSNGNCSTTGATLTINDGTASSSSSLAVNVCEGESYTFADSTSQIITSNISYVSTLTNSVGCDSVVTENITIVFPSAFTVYDTICEGEDYNSIIDNASFVNVLQGFTYTATLNQPLNADGCDSIVTEVITVLPAVTVDLGPDLTLCEGETVTIDAVTSSGNIPIWNTGDTVQSITYSGLVDTFFVAADSSSCGSATDTIFISVQTAPDVDAGPDVTIPLGATTTLNATSMTVPVDFVWNSSNSLSCTNCDSPVAGPIDNTSYIVTVIDENGCTNSDTVNVIIDGEIMLYIPNIFSPNGDGNNDYFEVYGPAWQEYSMKVFNRWGALIFESNDPNEVWDGYTKKGERCPQAVFVYKFEGKSIVGQIYKRAGNVMLAR